ncbi:MAG: hypothetical protein ACQGVK_24670 [Myxococcota bacterium]
MSRRTVNILLSVHLVVVWSAVVFRIDRYPLTWAPMYSTYSVSETVKRRVESQERARKGFRVRHRDGSSSFVGARDLNISKWIMSRVYYQRAFGKGPIKHRQGNQNLGALNRWIRGLGPDEPRFEVDWTPRLFWTLNKTLGFEPDDPEFIVRIFARDEKVEYDPASLELLDRRTRKRRLKWREEWREWWNDGPP